MVNGLEIDAKLDSGFLKSGVFVEDGSVSADYRLIFQIRKSRYLVVCDVNGTSSILVRGEC